MKKEIVLFVEYKHCFLVVDKYFSISLDVSITVNKNRLKKRDF